MHSTTFRMIVARWSRSSPPSSRSVGPDSLYKDLREISLRSAARLQGHELLTEADLYDEDGLPT